MTSTKRFVGVRLSPAGYRYVAELARRETSGNVSEMIRKLLAEAAGHRALRSQR